MFGNQTIIVLAGTLLLGVAAGMVGTFAVLRRRALMGDVIAHSALPGLCIAFLVFHSRAILVLLAGALLSGLLGAFVVSLMKRHTALREDAIQGIVLSVFYGGGIALTRSIQNRYRNESGADLEAFIIGRAATMLRSDVYQIAAVTIVTAVIVLLLYKELKLVSFDEQFCRVQGWSAGGLDLLLMVLTAVTVVVGLPSVGVVLTAALLIIPPAAARFWTDRLSKMMMISCTFGGLSGVTGTLISARFDGLPTGPLIVLTSTAIFLLSWLLAPHRGVLWNSNDVQDLVLDATMPDHGGKS
ncbi:metal ABC transporter permease [Fuerstiella marisgermanici]|uniref:Manganese transport system membrane protein MntB n=1 Tax=Fuerstiella marisgermanici TaxID=1891926 RepID=A0A1P8WGJ5_9PLAN|nr:metal ABC transporter permease [Fuerstiella marisgermanici]APZ93157.1 Manganese transport system membrane protein MntB [Fuerstiella marisgermanici]